MPQMLQLKLPTSRVACGQHLLLCNFSHTLHALFTQLEGSAAHLESCRAT